MVKNREAWRPAVHGVTKNQTQLSKLTTTKTQTLYRGMVENIAIHLRENKWSIFVLLYYKGLSIQYFYLENSMDRGVWRATAHRVTKSQT